MTNCNDIIDEVVRMLQSTELFSQPMESLKSPRRRHFTKDQETFLRALKQTNCNNREIADQINKRFGTNYTVKTIEQRWQRSSNPLLRKGNWNNKEDEQLRVLYKQYEGDIDEIAQTFRSRSRYQILQRLKRLYLL